MEKERKEERESLLFTGSIIQIYLKLVSKCLLLIIFFHAICPVFEYM